MDRSVTEGIIVDALPFRDNDCILTLFSPDEGMLKLFCRGAYKKGNVPLSASPLAHVEAIYTKGRSEMHRCDEISLLRNHVELRRDLPLLQAACDMIQAVKTTQQPGKPAPELFQLLCRYLDKLSTVPQPAAIASSFRLKLLRYEGLMGALSHCSVCSTLLAEAWVSEGQVCCSHHRPAASIHLTPAEYDHTLVLQYSREFPVLATVSITSELERKINDIFAERTK